MIQKRPTQPVVNFDAEAHLRELNERFGRLVKNLGFNNRRVFSMESLKYVNEGSIRYQFEVDFAYAVKGVLTAPTYMQGKMFDKAASVVSDLIAYLKENNSEAVESA